MLPRRARQAAGLRHVTEMLPWLSELMWALPAAAAATAAVPTAAAAADGAVSCVNPATGRDKASLSAQMLLLLSELWSFLIVQTLLLLRHAWPARCQTLAAASVLQCLLQPAAADAAHMRALRLAGSSLA